MQITSYIDVLSMLSMSSYFTCMTSLMDFNHVILSHILSNWVNLKKEKDMSGQSN